jgi:hypothetical protein
MKKITALLVIKPLIILALVLSLKPAAEKKVNITNNETMNEEVQAMRGYFLEDQAMKIIIFHKRVQSLKTALIESHKAPSVELKEMFVSMVKDFNKAIGEFEELEKYKSKTWNKHRQNFISLMKKVEHQQFELHKELGQMRKTVSI